MLKGFISAFFRKSKDSTDHDHGATMQVGNIYSFKTTPVTDFSPRETERYGVLKVLSEKEEGRICCAALDGVFGTPPTAKDVADLTVLILNRFRYDNQPATNSFKRDSENILQEFTFVARLKVSPQEQIYADADNSYSGWTGISANIEWEWRWRNDHQTLLEEHARQEEITEARNKAYELRQTHRLKHLTWDEFSELDRLSHWEPSPPAPALPFIKDLKLIFLSSANELKKLGEKPKRKDVRTVLKALVLAINDLNAEAGGVIETGEREDLMELITDIGYLTKQRPLIDEADDWREW